MIKITSTLVQKGSKKFPIVDGNSVRGGFFIVNNIIERDSIEKTCRKDGMICFVKNIDGVSKFFQLLDGIENTNWSDLNITGIPGQSSNGLDVEIDGEATEKILRFSIDSEDNSFYIKDLDGNNYLPNTNASNVEYIGNKSVRDILDDLLIRIDRIENKSPVTAIIISKSSIILELDDTITLTANTQPDEASKYIIWSSTNKDVATVDENGVITPKSIGIAVIVAQSSNPKITASCEVIVAEEGNSDKEVTEGVTCKLINSYIGAAQNEWEDLSGNDNNARLIGFTNNGEGIDGWQEDGGLRITRNQYLTLPNSVLSEETFCIEILADLLFSENDYEIKKLFAKKNDWNSMVLQVSTEDIMYGGSNGISTYEPLYNKGKILYTYNINTINKTIDIYINGDKYQHINLEEEGVKFGTDNLTKVLIGTNSEVDSASDMIIYGIKTFGRCLSDSECINEYEYLTGICDNLSNDIPSYAMSKGIWTENLPLVGIQKMDSVKSYKYMEVIPGNKYRLTIRNYMYSGSSYFIGYNETKTEAVVNLTDEFIFNKSILEFECPEEVYYFTFSLPIETDISIYYTLENINE